MIYKGKLEIKKDDNQSVEIATKPEHSQLSLTQRFESRLKTLSVENKAILINYTLWNALS